MKTQKIKTLKSVAQIAFITLLVGAISCSQKKGLVSVSKSDTEPPQEDIHMAVVTNNLAALKQHIAACSSINEKDAFSGSSPLITAASFGRTEAAKILVDAGADLNLTNYDGSTALHSAAFFCHPEIVKMLLDKNADKTIKNKYGSTAYESVVRPYSQVKSVYEAIQRSLRPAGLRLDFEYIEKTRPAIAAMLK